MSASPKKKMKFAPNKAKYYAKSQKEQFLMPGMQGFMATCNFREKDCVREAYNILNHYADEMEEGQKAVTEPTVEETSDDIADQLEKEVNAANSKQNLNGKSRFKSVATGASNCIFIRANVPDTVLLASRIVNDIKASGEQKTRFLLRLIPIEAVCRIDQLDSTAGQLFDKHFLKQSSTFSIAFNRRFNNDVKREKIIADLAELVHSKNVANRVDLNNPEKTVIVEIIKGLCLISVVPGYLQNKKYNLVELANANKNLEKEENKDSDTIVDEKAAKSDEVNEDEKNAVSQVIEDEKETSKDN